VKQQKQIRWAAVERLMLKAFTGGALTEAEQKTVEEAHKADPVEYGMLHTRAGISGSARSARCWPPTWSSRT